MSEPTENPDVTAPSFSPLVDRWTRAVSQVIEKADSFQQEKAADGDPKIWRRKWYDLLDQEADAFLRSPEFLGLLKGYVSSLMPEEDRVDDLQKGVHSARQRLTSDFVAMRRNLAELQALHVGLSPLPSRFSAETLEVIASGESPEESSPVLLGVTPSEIVYREGTLRLHHYRNDKVRFKEPIVVCFALVNRPYILDLQVERSVVRRLLDRGFDVYLIDWGVPGPAECDLQLEDYVGTMMTNVIDFVCQRTKADQLNLLGYCMGGTMSTIFTAFNPCRIRNLILMAAPIRFGTEDDGLLNLWARREYFDVDAFVNAWGNCPGEFLQFVFQLMKPVQNFAVKQLTLMENAEDREFLENFLILERWSSDAIPVAGATFRQYVKSLYQQNELVSGELRLGEESIRLASITCPILLLVAEKDHLVPPSSTLALEEYVSSTRVESRSVNAGHVGLAVSRKSHQQLWPPATAWIANHSTEST